MKAILSICGFSLFAFILPSSFSFLGNPQDPPKGEKVEKHIKILKIDDEGNKIELDTILQGNEVFLWNGDTIDVSGRDLDWVSEGIIEKDSLRKYINANIEYELRDDNDGHVFVMKSGKMISPQILKIETEGDSDKEYDIQVIIDDLQGENNVMHRNDDSNETRVIVHPKSPGFPVPPDAPHVLFLDRNKSGNVVDLNDPGIISYKKKKLNGGREKITIIRKEGSLPEKELGEEIIISENGDMSKEVDPHKVQRIKILKPGDEMEVEAEVKKENN